jgi:glycosyltransferase involved in cell wall biosynthesis
MIGGSAIMSRNLWGAWPVRDLVVLTQTYPIDGVDADTTVPGVEVHHAHPWWSRFPRLQTLCEPCLALRLQHEIRGLAAQRRPRAIFVNWPPSYYLLGAWLAARKLRLPLYVYMHSTWRETISSPRDMIEGLASRCLQRRVLRTARRVFFTTDAGEDLYRVRYGVDVYILKHCIPDADLANSSAATGGPVENVIHFVGSIYRVMNLDAMLNLVRALDLCHSGITLDGYTNHPESAAASGVRGTHVRLRFAPKAEVMAAQQRAAILFMPLAFRSVHPVEIRTVFPTKLLEYFVSGRPILVHAPPDSWTSRAARRDGWGEVVDQPDPGALAAAIDKLVRDPQRQRALVAAAFREARNRLASKVVQGLQQELGRLETSAEGAGRNAGSAGTLA